MKNTLLIALAAFAGIFTSCGTEESNTLVLGTSADYAPYEFHIMIDGVDTIVGFDIDIAKAIAAEMGKELVIEDISFDGLLQALNAGKVDMVISGMTPTEERAKSVDFSDIYYVAQQSVLVRTEDAGEFTTMESLAGKNVGAQLGSIQEGIVNDKLADSDLVALNRIPDLILELQNDKIDALVMETPVAKGYADSNADLTISSIDLEVEEGGSAIAIRKGNEEFLAQINSIIAKLKADGSIDRFVSDANLLNVPSEE